MMGINDHPGIDEGWWLLSVAEKCRCSSLVHAWHLIGASLGSGVWLGKADEPHNRDNTAFLADR